MKNRHLNDPIIAHYVTYITPERRDERDNSLIILSNVKTGFILFIKNNNNHTAHANIMICNLNNKNSIKKPHVTDVYLNICIKKLLLQLIAGRSNKHLIASKHA